MLKIDHKNLHYMSVGLNVTAGMFIFFYIGYVIDQKRGTQFGVPIGILLGLFYCGYEIWKLIRQLNKQDKG
jgi:hypothetical protein